MAAVKNFDKRTGAEEGADLDQRAREIQGSLDTELSTTPIETEFEDALATMVEAKQSQVERIEDRLETMIERQAAALKSAQDQRPGILALPDRRARWEASVGAQQTTAQLLQARLERIREIREGMSPSGPRLEELAMRKLRAQSPELVEGWKEMQEARRAHQLHLRLQEQQKQKRSASMQRGRRLDFDQVD